MMFVKYMKPKKNWEQRSKKFQIVHSYPKAKVKKLF